MNIFDQMTDDEQKTMLAALKALKDAYRSEPNLMPDWIGDPMAGVGAEGELFAFMSSDRSLSWVEGERLFRESTRAFGRMRK